MLKSPQVRRGPDLARAQRLVKEVLGGAETLGQELPMDGLRSKFDELLGQRR